VRHLLWIFGICHALVWAQPHHVERSLLERLSKEEKLAYTNLAIASGVLVWGFTQWGYGDEDFHFRNEGWFERKTSNGGSDKLGHFYTNYLVTRLLAPLYKSWGYSEHYAALYGALTAGMLSGVLIELGDGFSEHGFSREDFIADMLGVVAGYFFATMPSLAQKIDFRVEYNPFLQSDNVTDISTDYERMKHLLVLKAEGFEMFHNTLAQYLELHVGYYTRNFNHDTLPLEGRKRYLYVGIGINLSKLLAPYVGSYARLFNYFQLPYTDVSYKHAYE